MASEAKEKAKNILRSSRQRGDEFKVKASELQSKTFHSYERADSGRKNPFTSWDLLLHVSE